MTARLLPIACGGFVVDMLGMRTFELGTLFRKRWPAISATCGLTGPSADFRTAHTPMKIIPP